MDSLHQDLGHDYSCNKIPNPICIVSSSWLGACTDYLRLKTTFQDDSNLTLCSSKAMSEHLCIRCYRCFTALMIMSIHTSQFLTLLAPSTSSFAVFSCCVFLQPFWLLEDIPVSPFSSHVLICLVSRIKLDLVMSLYKNSNENTWSLSQTPLECCLI